MESAHAAKAPLTKRQMMKERPAVQRAIDLGKAGAQHDQNVSNNTVLFNQGAGHLRNQ